MNQASREDLGDRRSSDRNMHLAHLLCHADHMDGAQRVHDRRPDIPSVPKQTSGVDPAAGTKTFSLLLKVSTKHTPLTEMKSNRQCQLKILAIQEFISSVLAVG